MTQTEPQEAAPAAGSEAVADFKKSLMDQVRAAGGIYSVSLGRRKEKPRPGPNSS
jgi:hypothetical protein